MNIFPKKVIASEDHAFSLDQNGAIHCWGDNSNGELGLGHNDIINNIRKHNILNSEKVKEIAAKGNQNIALMENGKVLIWPFEKNSGKLIFQPVEIPLKEKVISISCGENFTM